MGSGAWKGPSLGPWRIRLDVKPEAPGVHALGVGLWRIGIDGEPGVARGTLVFLLERHVIFIPGPVGHVGSIQAFVA